MTQLIESENALLGRTRPLNRFREGGAAAIQRILMQRPRVFRRTRRLESVAQEMRLKGVFATEGGDWSRQRRIVTAALNRQKLRNFFPKLALTIARLQRRWEGAADRGDPVDVCGDLMRFTVDVTMQLAFSVDANTLETPGPVIQRHLNKVLPVLYRRSNAPFAWWRFFRLPADRALDRALEAIEREVGEMIRAARQRMAADPGRPPPVRSACAGLGQAVSWRSPELSVRQCFDRYRSICGFCRTGSCERRDRFGG